MRYLILALALSGCAGGGGSCPQPGWAGLATYPNQVSAHVWQRPGNGPYGSAIVNETVHQDAIRMQLLQQQWQIQNQQTLQQNQQMLPRQR